MYAKGEYRETRARPNVDPDSEVAPDGFAERNVRVREFAGVAGATARQRFRYITLPLVFPTLIIAMLFRTVQAMRVYGVIEATGAGCTTVPSLSCTVVESMFGATQAYGTAAVAAVPTAASIGVVVSVYIVALRKAGGEAGPV